MQTALIQAQRWLSGEMGKRGDSIASSECDSSTDRFLFVISNWQLNELMIATETSNY